MNYKGYLEENYGFSPEEQDKIFNLHKQIKYYARYYKNGGEKVNKAKEFIIENYLPTLNNYLISSYDLSDFSKKNNIDFMTKTMKTDCCLKRIMTNEIYNYSFTEGSEHLERKCYKAFIDKDIVAKYNKRNIKSKNILKTFTEKEVLDLIKNKKIILVAQESLETLDKIETKNDIQIKNEDFNKVWSKSEKLILNLENIKSMKAYEKYYPNLFNEFLRYTSDNFNIIYKAMLNEANPKIKSKYIKTRKINTDNEMTM